MNKSYTIWFYFSTGPEAQLTSQAEMSRNGLVNLDAAQDNYAPSKGRDSRNVSEKIIYKIVLI